MSEVGILIVDDDVSSQRALKNILDAEGWRVRIVPLATHAMTELASGQWNLVIVNVELLDLHGPIFTTLKELAQASVFADGGTQRSERKRLRVLFLVPLFSAKEARALLEREGLPYSLKPYHLHEFLEKVSDLLVEAGALQETIRSDSFRNQKRRDQRVFRETRRGVMFASREDYQMTEEEISEFERQEEEERKKRLQKERESF